MVPDLLPVQVPVIAAAKAAEESPRTQMWKRTQMVFWTLSFSLAQSNLCAHLGNESADERFSVSLSPTLSPSLLPSSPPALCNSDFEVNKINIKKKKYEV